MKTIKEATQDLNHLKFENQIFCQHCKQHRAHFRYLTITGDLLNIIFNCSECGQDFQFSWTYEKLREIYFKKETGDQKTLFDCFNLGLWFNTVFLSSIDKELYGKWICRLNKDTSGIRKFWYRRKYAN